MFLLHGLAILVGEDDVQAGLASRGSLDAPRPANIHRQRRVQQQGRGAVEAEGQLQRCDQRSVRFIHPVLCSVLPPELCMCQTVANGCVV